MFYLFFIFSLIFCSLCFFNMDPMKSSFFLIFSLLSVMPIVSLGVHIWYSYFICLLFLSGIFVILVYFSSLSKINFVKSKMVLFSFLMSFFLISPIFLSMDSNLNLNNFYFYFYIFYLFFIIIILLFFMNFSSYFLNFSGALRKV